MNPKIANGIAVVVALVWAGSYLASAFVKNYDRSPWIDFIMMGLCGAAFGNGFLKVIANLGTWVVPKLPPPDPTPPEPPPPPPVAKKTPAKKATTKKAPAQKRTDVRQPVRVRPPRKDSE